MPRLFVALDVPADVRDALAALRTDLDGVRWTRPAQLHLTLRFLGDTDAARIPDLEAALAEIAAPRLALRLGGLTAFLSPRRPRVLVARVAPDEALAELQRQIEEAVQALGWEPEERPFRPHVTLARLKHADPRAVRTYLGTRTVGAAFTADAFHLWASTLRPAGALHERLASFESHPP